MSSAALLQYLVSGVTTGAVYALVGIGFSLIYNASHVVNFAQGEFVMIGGMATAALIAAGLPMLPASLLAVLLAVLVGMIIEVIAIRRTRATSPITMIILTLGLSILLRGSAQLLWGKDYHKIPPFTGDTPILVGGAALQPQSLWVIAVTLLLITGLAAFFGLTLLGKSVLATANNRLAAQLAGIRIGSVLRLSYAVSAALGAIAGILITPISLTYYNVGIILGLKGFAAAILGGFGNPAGAIAGGLILGLAEVAGVASGASGYKDAIAFLVILGVLFVRPSGLFGIRSADRV